MCPAGQGGRGCTLADQLIAAHRPPCRQQEHRGLRQREPDPAPGRPCARQPCPGALPSHSGTPMAAAVHGRRLGACALHRMVLGCQRECVQQLHCHCSTAPACSPASACTRPSASWWRTLWTRQRASATCPWSRSACKPTRRGWQHAPTVFAPQHAAQRGGTHGSQRLSLRPAAGSRVSTPAESQMVHARGCLRQRKPHHAARSGLPARTHGAYLPQRG